MGFWDILIPEATTNLVNNPSFETNTTGWTTGGTNTIARSSDEQAMGVYSLKCTYSNNATLASFAITLTAAAHTVTAEVYVPSNYDGTDLQLQLQNFTSATIANGDVDMTITDQWQRVTATITPDAGDLAGNVVLYENGTAPTATRFVYLDAVQVEAKAYATTYCDGTQDGCRWLGAAHASTSSREALAATGGKICNFENDLDFDIVEQNGTGVTSVTNTFSALALRPGDLFESQKLQSRQMTLGGTIIGDDPEDFHTKKQALVSALSPVTVKIGDRAEPRTLRYTGATVDKEIKAVYDAGLENGLQKGWASDYQIRMMAHDPLFYDIRESGAVLDTVDSFVNAGLSVRGINGLWTNGGITTGGGPIYAIAEDDTYIYVGGFFTNMNGNANSDYIARYNKETATWSALGTGMNGDVNGLLITSDGTLYATGNFTSAGGTAANYIASWDGSTWSALGSGLGAEGNALAIDSTGLLYVGGEFTTAGGTAANYIASWDGSTWSALGSGLSAACNALTVANDDTLYLTGDFALSGGVVTGNVSAWDGSAYVQLGTPPSGGVGNALGIDANGLVYAGGTFTTNHIGGAVWNGFTWSDIGSGFASSADIRSITIGDDGLVYFAGNFSVSSPAIVDFAIWNGSLWRGLDATSSGTIAYYIRKSETGLYLATGAVSFTYSGNATITYTGTERAWPIIHISRAAGNAATIRQITNETTGAALYFNYSLLDGETLTIDTRPGKQSVTSSYRGNVYSELLPSSDFGSFYLLHGNGGSLDNLITCFVNQSGTNTITATIQWKTAYISED